MAKVGAIPKILGKISQSKPLNKLGNAFQKDPEKALAVATVTSIILKDGVGCYMYVTQSMHNKKIPDERRPFVAALDLTNGGLMILAQILLFLGMRKYSGPLFNKIFHKSFNDVTKANTISRVRMNMANRGEAVAKKLKIEKEYDAVRKSGLDVFKFILDISAATIVGKRIVVPLIATPMASKVEKWMTKRQDAKKAKLTGAENPQLKEPLEKEQVANIVEPPKVQESTNLLARYRK